MALPAPFQEILNEFSLYADARSRLSALIVRGKQLQPLPEPERTGAYQVPGCLSTVHIKGEICDGIICYKGDADALLIKGMVALLIEGLGGCTPEEVIGISPDELQQTGLGQTLVPSRSNGLRNIFLRMQEEARRLLIQ